MTEQTQATRRNPAAIVQEVPVATTNPAPLPYAETINRMARYANTDEACTGFNGVRVVLGTGRVVTLDFEVVRVGWFGEPFAVIRPHKPRA